MPSLNDFREGDEFFPGPISPGPDLTRLAARLGERDYHQHARGSILTYARAMGTLEGCPEVDPEDRADLDAILEAAWPAVPITSGAWDDRWVSPRAIERRDGRGPAATARIPGAAGLSASWTLARPDRLEALAGRFEAEQFGDEVPWDGPGADEEGFDPSEEDEAFLAAWISSRDPEPDDLAGREPFHP